MTGSLQIKRDKYYAVLSWYEGEQRKQKWVATGLAVKGNKRRAENVLRQEIEKMRLIRAATSRERISLSCRSWHNGWRK